MAFGSKLTEPVILIHLKLCRSPEKQLQRLSFIISRQSQIELRLGNGK